jgi:undecaprenyl-diphosphatase
VDWLANRRNTPAFLVVAMLVWFGVVLGCAILAGELLELAERANGSTSIDSSITSWMVTHRTDALTAFARAASTVGSQKVLAPLVGVIAVLLLARRQFVLTSFLIVAWGGALLLYSLTKAVVTRPRPPSDIWLTTTASSSFPSGHATQSLGTFLALALVGGVFLARARAAAVALAVVLGAWIGWSRVYLGVHWATDVVAGWLIGAVWVVAVAWLARRAAGPTSDADPTVQPGRDDLDLGGSRAP